MNYQRLWHFIGDNLHEMPKPIFWENMKNTTNFSSAELAQSVVKVWNINKVYIYCKISLTDLKYTFKDEKWTFTSYLRPHHLWRQGERGNLFVCFFRFFTIFSVVFFCFVFFCCCFFVFCFQKVRDYGMIYVAILYLVIFFPYQNMYSIFRYLWQIKYIYLQNKYILAIKIFIGIKNIYWQLILFIGNKNIFICKTNNSWQYNLFIGNTIYLFAKKKNFFFQNKNICSLISIFIGNKR